MRVANVRILITGAQEQVGQALVAVLLQQHLPLPFGQPMLESSKLSAHCQVTALHSEPALHSAAFMDIGGCARDADPALVINGLCRRGSPIISTTLRWLEPMLAIPRSCTRSPS